MTDRDATASTLGATLTERHMPSDSTFAELARRAATQYRTVEDMVTWAIREAILAGLYRPGDKLRQEQLAHDLGVSRVPVRASLRTLEAEGLVVISPHKGAAVRGLRPEELAEIYDLRIVLETFALRSAIEHLTDEQIDELERIADALDNIGEDDDLLALRERFTSTLLTMAKRPRTADIVARLRADVGRYWLGFRVVRGRHSSHRLLVDALRNRDVARAEVWIRDHFTTVSEQLQALMAERSQGAPKAAKAGKSAKSSKSSKTSKVAKSSRTARTRT